jgi:peptide/nickel transport system ATP-binding protein
MPVSILGCGMLEPQAASAHAGTPLLEIRDLSVSFRTRGGTVRAVNNLSLTLDPGRIRGIVGESGSGKSVSMMSVLRLIRDANATITGEIIFDGQNLADLGDRALQRVRGREIAMIFQDPMTALTPVYTIGWHISEQIRAHEKVSKHAARGRAIELLREVGIPAPERRVDAYPHELSGGMRQRAVIAMALGSSPRLLIADEPTTALDVTTQAQVLHLMMRLRESHGSSIIIVTHDMGVVSQVADDVTVMYGGRPIEEGTKAEVFRSPRHPYTWGLLGAVPRVSGAAVRRLTAIPGAPVSAGNLPSGCPFRPRCQWRHDACDVVPPMAGSAAAPDHRDACWLPKDERAVLRRQLRTLDSPLGDAL